MTNNEAVEANRRLNQAITLANRKAAKNRVEEAEYQAKIDRLAFKALEESERYKELAALPLTTTKTVENTYPHEVSMKAVCLDANGKDYNLACLVFANGTRSEFTQKVIELGK